MPLDLTGISNVGDFYSPHYLESLLEGDLRALFERWRKRTQEAGQTEETARTPDRLFSACATDYFVAKSKALRATNAGNRYEDAHPVHAEIARALGYPVQNLGYELVGDRAAVPVLCALQRDGAPYLWIVEAPFTTEDGSPFDEVVVPEQVPELEEGLAPSEEPWQKLPALIFAREQPPRWLFLMAGRHLVLMDRTKWAQGQYLLFDLDEIYSRRQSATVRAVAALLARESLCPDDGTVLLDTLDEQSHRHAFAVSKDLKYGVRRAVELLGNEYIYYKREVAHDAVFSDEQLAQELTTECLTYLYRLLFLFYAEARASELEILPLKSEEYRLGYSLESLRDLEQVPLTTDKARNGYFLHESLTQLFGLINDGYRPEQAVLVTEEAVGEAARQLDSGGFAIQGLHSPLFDRRRTPRLSSVRFRNSVLQEVIALLSLSREGRRNRGRVSYATLGINQLGAVYEGLLSYSGFFANERLYEVKKAGTEANDETEQSYFVPESSLHKYTEEEIVTEETGEGERRRRVHERGSFIFRLAGRDREKSASYYTPECLTQCLVKYALKELIGEREGDENWRTADEILALTVCEPAMGSAAFLNEAVNQLSEAYLARKQHELDQRIPPEMYREELQRVKEYIATRNCYGVDLNPTAVELGKVSLWLNIIHRGMAAPWFGLRLVAGNSLIGARRQVFSAANVAKGDWLKAPSSFPEDTWQQYLVPEAVSLANPGSSPYQIPPRPEGSIYHFLVPAKGMAAFDGDRVIRDLAPEDNARIRAWRGRFCTKPDKGDLKTLQRLSDRVDALWERAIQERQGALAQTDDELYVWPQPAGAGRRASAIDAKERVVERLHAPWSAYSRLKLVMDYWCALWFWPVSDGESLPSWDEWLLDLQLILEGSATGVPADQGRLPGVADPSEQAELAGYVSQFGFVNVDEMCTNVARLARVREVAGQHRYHHWELTSPGAFVSDGGFALAVGNPPWIKLEWKEAGVLSEFEPSLAIRGLDAGAVTRERVRLLEVGDARTAFISEFESQEGAQTYLGDSQNAPLLRGVQSNLYKSFVDRSWGVCNRDGVTGLIHPDGLYKEEGAASLRSTIYRRLRRHFHFRNELGLFQEILHTRQYGIHIYGGLRSEPAFDHIVNLYHPSTIDECYAHDGHGPVPGQKTEDGRWETRGHAHRIARVSTKELTLFASLFDEPGTQPLRAKLGALHAGDLVEGLMKISAARMGADPSGAGPLTTRCWEETAAKRDGTLKSQTQWANGLSEWVLSGPHIFANNPLYQTPKVVCTHPMHYGPVDLTAIPADYCPRTLHMPACGADEYRQRLAQRLGAELIGCYRLAWRRRIDPAVERTLMASIVPPGLAHVDTVTSLGGIPPDRLCLLAALWGSLPVDFYVKSTGRGDWREGCLSSILLAVPEGLQPHMASRALRLNCLTPYYSSLWADAQGGTVCRDQWAKRDTRLVPWCGQVTQDWSRNCAARTEYARRQLTVELDALAAIALGLTEEQLIVIYRLQFPTLQANEAAYRYDQRGKVAPTAVLREWDRRGKTDEVIEWERSLDFLPEHQRDLAHVPAEDRFVAGLPLQGSFDPTRELWYPPFTACDRETDMRQAYRHFRDLTGG